MPDLSFHVEGAHVVPHSTTPLLGLHLRVTNADAAEAIHTAVLRCQVQLEVTRRRYTADEQAGLFDLFGEPERWGRTLRAMLWTHTSAVVPPFQGETVVDLPLPCTFDFNVAATKYFHALEEGEVPLLLLFSGTIFYAADDGSLQAAPVAWDREARFRLPVRVWRDMMDRYYPNSAWLCLRRDVFDRLHDYKMRRGLPTWEEALEGLLRSAEEVTP